MESRVTCVTHGFRSDRILVLVIVTHGLVFCVGFYINLGVLVSYLPSPQD